MQITFEHINSPEELRVLADALARLADARDKHRAEFRQLVADVAPQADEEPAPAPKRSKPTKPAPTQPAAEPAPAEIAAPEPVAESPSEPAITLEQVRAKLAALSNAGHKAAVKDLLEQFGVAKLTDLSADRYGALMAAAEEI